MEGKDLIQVFGGTGWARTWFPSSREMHFSLEDLSGMLDSLHSFPAGPVVKRTGWQRCPWWVGKCMDLWQWTNGFTNMWSSFSLPTPFLFTASSWAPRPQYRLGMMRRTRGRSLSILPTWGRHSRLWMNCGGTFRILPVPFWKELAGWESLGTEKSGYCLLMNSSSSPPTLKQSFGFPSQTLIETECLSEISLFFVFNTYHFSAESQGKNPLSMSWN